ncbi:hypothetical protein [Flavobacterium branchiarum]|uniref:Uncharacterized protein n=1 Tax=Flavobacterium branchiarum TaxID=1114870 RepID=A0ABV5FHH9_9FLAO
MKNQVIKPEELSQYLFVMPNKVLVTEVTFLNGLKSKIVTGIPPGINWNEIYQGVKMSLSTQKNVASMESTLFEKEEGVLEASTFYSKIDYNQSNRLTGIYASEFFTKIGYTTH